VPPTVRVVQAGHGHGSLLGLCAAPCADNTHIGAPRPSGPQGDAGTVRPDYEITWAAGSTSRVHSQYWSMDHGEKVTTLPSGFS
jgi:hypothetical protein